MTHDDVQREGDGVSRWIRLNIDFHLSEWIVPLSAEARHAWVMLLCHTKANGHGGRVKAIDPLTASRLWFMGEESVRQMLIAAEQHGAITKDGTFWVVSKWDEHQGDGAAERMQRYRNRQSQTQGVTDVTRNVTKTETETETETIEPNGSIRPKKSRPTGIDQVTDYLSEIACPNPRKEAEKYLDHFTANGWVVGKARSPVKDWRACARTWARNAKDWAGEPTKEREYESV